MNHPLVVNISDNEPYDVLVMRPERWGNPFVIVPGRVEREEVIVLHHNWIKRATAAPTHDLYELRGQVLGCCCAPKPCHADTLARMSNNPFTLKAYSRLS